MRWKRKSTAPPPAHRRGFLGTCSRPAIVGHAELYSKPSAAPACAVSASASGILAFESGGTAFASTINGAFALYGSTTLANVEIVDYL